MPQRASGRIKRQGCANYAWRKKPKMRRRSRPRKTSKPLARAFSRSQAFLQALLDFRNAALLLAFGSRPDTSQLSRHDFSLPIWIQRDAKDRVASAAEKLQTRAGFSGDFIPRSDRFDENGHDSLAFGAFSRHVFLRGRRSAKATVNHYHLIQASPKFTFEDAAATHCFANAILAWRAAS